MLDIEVKDICGKYKEVIIDNGSAIIETGTLDDDERKELAQKLISAAQELLDY